MSEPEDTSESTFEEGFYAWGEWNELAPYPYGFMRWRNSLDEVSLKKYFPKEWAKKFGGLQKGKVYTYNTVKGYENTILKPGDRVKLVHTCPDLALHVEVECMEPEKEYKGLMTW